MRPRLVPSVAEVWRQYRYAQLAVLLCASYDVAFGLILALGGPARVASPSFGIIRQTGGPITWGLIVAVLGALIAMATLLSRRGLAWTLGLAALAHLFLMSGFVVAARTLPDAALTGIPTYAFVAGAHAIQSMVHNRPTSPSAP